MITALKIEDRDTWLEWRKQDVTAHDIGALFNAHPFKTEAGLYAIKAGVITVDDDKDNQMLKRGRMLQAVAATLLRERHPDWDLRENTQYYRDDTRRIGGTPDYYLQSESGLIVVETKVVARSVFHSKWLDENGDNPQPELYMLLQVMTQMWLTKAQSALIAVLVIGDFTFELHEVEVPWHQETWDKIESAVAAFWKSVEQRTPPEFDYGRDAKMIKQIYSSVSPDSQIDMRGNNRFVQLIEDRVGYLDAKKRAEEALDATNAEILAMMQDKEQALVNGWTVKARMILRKEYTVAAGSYRRLDVRKEKMSK